MVTRKKGTAVVSLNTNVQALNAQRLVGISSAAAVRTGERISSGLRVQRASDDPSGLGVAAVLTSQIRGDRAGHLNLQRLGSMLQVADAGLERIGEALQRMRELAVQANNTALSAQQLDALDAEFQSLKTAIDGIATGSTFNGVALLVGPDLANSAPSATVSGPGGLLPGRYTYRYSVGNATETTFAGLPGTVTVGAGGGAVTIGVPTITPPGSGTLYRDGPSGSGVVTTWSGTPGPIADNGAVLTGSPPTQNTTRTTEVQSGAATAQTVSVGTGQDFRSAGIGLGSAGGGESLATTTAAQSAQDVVDAALSMVGEARTGFAGTQQQIDRLVAALDATVLANEDARSRILDADMAAEVAASARQQLLVQSGASALTSANSAQRFVAELLRAS